MLGDLSKSFISSLNEISIKPRHMYRPFTQEFDDDDHCEPVHLYGLQ